MHTRNIEQCVVMQQFRLLVKTCLVTKKKQQLPFASIATVDFTLIQLVVQYKTFIYRSMCVCGAAVPWHAACFYIQVYMCGFSVVVRLCFGALLLTDKKTTFVRSIATVVVTLI